MINFINAEKSFKEYLKDYDLKNGSINLKVVHTYGVVKSSEYLAVQLKLDDENIQLAKIIALLHDIGRFEQVKITNSFSDRGNFDHADYGVKILFEDGLIRKFVQDSKYDDIIYKAILNHNKIKIEDGLDELTLLHCKIIRDADKLDNFRVKITESFESNYPQLDMNTINKDTISDNVYKSIMNKELVRSADRNTLLDYWFAIIAFVFDLYFNESLKYVKEHDYINTLIDKYEYNKPDTKLKVEQIRDLIENYLEN